MKRFLPFKKKALIRNPFTNLFFIVPACLLILGIVSIFFGVTEAKFLDKSEDAYVIQAGTWWDGSDLAVLDQSSHEKDACSLHELHFQIKNNGYSMLDTTAYQLFYSQEDKPIQTGNIIDEGNISPINENNQETLIIEVNKEGFYQVVIEQRPSYQDNEENNSTVSSEIITIHCEEELQEKSTEQNEDEKEIEQKTQVEPPNQNDEKESTEKADVPPSEEAETEQTKLKENSDKNKDPEQEEASEKTSEKATPPENEKESDTNTAKEGMEDEIKNGEREVKENTDAEKDLEVPE